MKDINEAHRGGEDVVAMVEKLKIQAPAATQAAKNTVQSRPQIDITDLDLPIKATAAWEALGRRNDPPVLFRREGLVHRVITDSTGTRMELVDIDGLSYEVARAARFATLLKSGDWRLKPPPPALIRDMLAAPEKPLPRLDAIIKTPRFGNDGTLVSMPGYNPTTGLLYAPTRNLMVPHVPDSPTREDVREARRRLEKELLIDFPLAGVADVAHAIGLVVVLFARRLIDGQIPHTAVTANSPGTGKTLLVDAALSIPGVDTGKMPEPTGEAELRKNVTANLIEGREVLVFDNLRRRLDSATFAMAITTGFWIDRILGVSRTARLPMVPIITTANNLSTSTEIARRTVPVRLVAQEDRPWMRDVARFRHPDLLGYCRERQGDLVWAALVLVKNWQAQQHPYAGKTLGSFESWSRVIGGILECAGIAGFLTNQDSIYADLDSQDAPLREFVHRWWARFQANPVGVKDLFAVAQDIDDLLPLSRNPDIERGRRTSLGNLLRENRDRVFGQYRIVAVGEAQRAKQYALKLVGEARAAGVSPNDDPVRTGSGDFGSVSAADDSAPSVESAPPRRTDHPGPKRNDQDGVTVDLHPNASSPIPPTDWTGVYEREPAGRNEAESSNDLIDSRHLAHKAGIDDVERF